jgi:hypothetical protein
VEREGYLERPRKKSEKPWVNEDIAEKVITPENEKRVNGAE